LAKLYEAFRRVNAGGSSLEQLVTIILKAVRNLVNSEHNLLLFVDNSRDQLWTKWTLGTVMDNKVCCLMPLSCWGLFLCMLLLLSAYRHSLCCLPPYPPPPTLPPQLHAR